VKDKKTGTLVADHLWVDLTKEFMLLKLNSGDMVEFRARVKKYVKGYKGWRAINDAPIETDYTLVNPTKVKKV